jgi:hypothetical protein
MIRSLDINKNSAELSFSRCTVLKINFPSKNNIGCKALILIVHNR